MTTETLRTDKPREILALVNYQLGFCPTESLVVVSLRGPRSRAGLIARIDLAAAETAAGSLARHLAADKASSAAILVYTSDADLAHDGALFVADAIHRAGITTVGTWWVTDTDYRRIEPLSPRTCPTTGQPLNLDTTVIAAAMTRNGATVRPTRAALGVTPANEEDRDEAATAEAAWHQAMTTDTQPRQTARDMWQDTLSGTACTPTRAGRLAAALTDVVVRDAVLCSLIPDLVGPANHDLRCRPKLRRPGLGAPTGHDVDREPGPGPQSLRHQHRDVENAVVGPRVGKQQHPGGASPTRAAVRAGSREGGTRRRDGR